MTTPLSILLIGRGVRSDLAERVARKYSDWQSFCSADVPTLSQCFTEADLEQLRRAKMRREISAATVRRLADESDLKCCLCWNIDSDSGVVIHHIESHSDTLDDSYENLIVLCSEHHSKVHTKWELSRHPLPPDVLKRRKAEFCLALAEFKAGRRNAPGREKSALLGVMVSPPLPPSHFTGRDALVREVAQQLTRSKLAAIVGMGGCGKTAAALEVAQCCRQQFSGGSLWSEIASDAAGIAGALRTWIRSLGSDIADLQLDEQFALFAQLLAERVTSEGPILLIIDGASEPDLKELVRLNSYLPAGVAALVTTRETTVAAAIGAAGFQIQPLDRANSRKLLGSLSGPALAKADEKLVDDLLSLVGDLPLAVELVARHLAVFHNKPEFSIETLIERLKQFDLRLLAFPGHRGIAVSFALSYDSLNDLEQAIFRCLGVFAFGPLNTSRVAAVASEKEEDAETILDRLVSVSMLNWGPARGDYRLHPLLHKYSELLFAKADSAERQSVTTRFYRHFTTIAINTARDAPKDLDVIDRIYRNLTKAIYYADANGDHLAICEAMLGLSAEMTFFLSRNLESESIPLLELAIRHATLLEDKNLEAALIAHLGTAHNRLGILEKAIESYRRAIKIVRETGNDFDLASDLQNLGCTLMNRAADLPEAERSLREGLAAAERSRNLDALLGCFSSLGSLHRQIGNLEEAERLYAAALKMARLIGEPLSIGNNLSNLGLVRNQLGNPQGESMIREALTIASRIGDKRGEGNRRGHLGGILMAKARQMPAGPEQVRALDNAREHIMAAVDLARETQDPHKIAVWTMNLGSVHALKGDIGAALDLYKQALEVAKAGGFTEVEAQANCNLGSTNVHLRRLDTALAYFRAARLLLRGTQSPILAQAEAYAERLEEMLSTKV